MHVCAQVLHPVFQEDELTLVLVGAVLGLIVGYGQLVWDQKDKLRASIEACATGDEEACDVVLSADEPKEMWFPQLVNFLSRYGLVRWSAKRLVQLWEGAEAMAVSTASVAEAAVAAIRRPWRSPEDEDDGGTDGAASPVSG